MNCKRCGLAFSEKYPEWKDYGSHGAIDFCLRAQQAELERLREIERKALDQSEYIQTHGLTEIEVHALRAELADYAALIALQHTRPVEAARAYQQAHDWPDTKFPNLGELVAWLLSERAAK